MREMEGLSSGVFLSNFMMRSLTIGFNFSLNVNPYS